MIFPSPIPTSPAAKEGCKKSSIISRGTHKKTSSQLLTTGEVYFLCGPSSSPHARRPLERRSSKKETRPPSVVSHEPSGRINSPDRRDISIPLPSLSSPLRNVGQVCTTSPLSIPSGLIATTCHFYTPPALRSWIGLRSVVFLNLLSDSHSAFPE